MTAGFVITIALIAFVGPGRTSLAQHAPGNAPGNARWYGVTAVSKLTLHDDVITLGRLFIGVPKRQANIAVARAPTPGKSTWLDRELMQRIATRFKLHWIPKKAYKGIRVRRLGYREMDEAALLGMLRKRLIDEYQLPDRTKLRFDQKNIKLVLLGEKTVPEISKLDYDSRTGRFIARLRARTPQGQEALTLSGRARSMIDIPVLTRSIVPGETIESEDVTMQPVPLTRLARGVITSPRQLIGQTASQSLRPGRPLQQGQIVAKKIVHRNDLVTIMLQTKGLQLNAQGRALENGSINDVIRVMNTRSKQTVQARVIGPRLVAVEIPVRGSR